MLVTRRFSFIVSFCSVSEPDKGIYDAMNKGAKLANAESFLLWINAGDSLHCSVGGLGSTSVGFI